VPARSDAGVRPVSDSARAVRAAAAAIASADALIFAAGAGMGVDSGLPDFRGNEGFWAAYPALGRERIDFTAIASPDAFASDPRRAWGFYGHRLALYRRTVPHAGFATLRRWRERVPHGAFVFTSNVDGQFQKAGTPPDRVVECHGSIHHLQCLRNCAGAIWPADRFVPDVDEAACRLVNDPPACPTCGGLARPNVLMFGDWGWLAARARAQEARLEAWLARVHRPVVIELGAGVAIPSVRDFAEGVVTHYGGTLVRINPREPEVERGYGVGLREGALAGLAAIDAALAAR
jgi:NAD-dependent SIR2 family protein deacetylase